MCGLVAGYSEVVRQGVAALRHRGPDAEGVTQVGPVWLGHTRLAILDLDARSNQPFVYQHITLIYNGELWNYQALRLELQALGYPFATPGDTEVVAAALACWGPHALARFNGMFALVWTQTGETVWLARDRYGEIPLHMAKQRPFLCASERKVLLALGASPRSIVDVLPGSCVEATVSMLRQSLYTTPCLQPLQVSRLTAASRIRQYLLASCRERTVSDVPVCTLLSGGIDSSIVAYGLRQTFSTLVAYTCVHAPKSRDRAMARLVASFLGIELREIYVPLPTQDDLAEVICHIEMPYKAQIEIGWACLVVARQMQRDGFHVTFSGEGSDELWASYGFAYHALQHHSWYQYRRHLFFDQHRKNFARCNKIFMAHGIECRLPFLNPRLVEYALRLPQHVVQEGRRYPKALLQAACADSLPPAICSRPKIAFQDGLGLKAAIAQKYPQRERFYRAEYVRHFGPLP